MKKILSMILIGALIIMANCLPTLASETENSAEELGRYEIMNGDPDGNLRLSDELTRAEAVTLLVRLYGFVPENSDAAPANEFSDMEGHWACNAAMIAKNLRILDEGGGDIFCPDENITSEAFLKMVICLLGYNEVAEQRGSGHIGCLIQASQLGVTKGLSLATGQSITREEAAKILCNSLDIPLMVMTSFGFGESDSRYIIMNGKNGQEYRTVRTMLENK